MIQYASAQLSVAVFQVFILHSGYFFAKYYLQLNRKHIWWPLLKGLLLVLEEDENLGVQHMIFPAVWLNHQLNFSAQLNQFDLFNPMTMSFGVIQFTKSN